MDRQVLATPIPTEPVHLISLARNQVLPPELLQACDADPVGVSVGMAGATARAASTSCAFAGVVRKAS
jgi:hypothetical protein